VTSGFLADIEMSPVGFVGDLERALLQSLPLDVLARQLRSDDAFVIFAQSMVGRVVALQSPISAYAASIVDPMWQWLQARPSSGSLRRQPWPPDARGAACGPATCRPSKTTFNGMPTWLHARVIAYNTMSCTHLASYIDNDFVESVLLPLCVFNVLPVGAVGHKRCEAKIKEPAVEVEAERLLGSIAPPPPPPPPMLSRSQSVSGGTMNRLSSVASLTESIEHRPPVERLRTGSSVTATGGLEIASVLPDRSGRSAPLLLSHMLPRHLLK